MTLFGFKRFISIVFILPAIFVYIGCSDNSQSFFQSENDSSKFPERFIEKGSDSDHTYVSLQTSRTEEDFLQVRVTSWGIVETGLFLDESIKESELILEIHARCGTITSTTWEKVSFSLVLDRKEEQMLDIIIFNHGYKLRLEK